MAIRNAVQDGAVGEAISRVNDLSPELLDQDPALQFRVKKQQFLELVQPPQPLSPFYPPKGSFQASAPPAPPVIVQTFSPGLRPITNHLEERLLDQAQARASFTPLFGARSRSMPQCMVSDV